MNPDPIAAYYAMSPTKYRALVSLLLSQGDSPRGEMEQQVEIVLAEGADLGGAKLRLNFEGVRDLQLRQTDFSLITFSHIEIRRTEKVFAIRSEDGLLSFACHTFSCSKT